MLTTRKSSLATPLMAMAVFTSVTNTARAGETLYNGIVLPDSWPPKIEKLTREPLAQPGYLVSPPKVVPIDVGRQLFVDDFLIETTTLVRTHHLATYHPANPVIIPETASDGVFKQPWRTGAGVFSDGVWYDPADKTFKAWYWGGGRPRADRKGLGYYTCYATSHDGIHWQKPQLDVVPGTNIVLVDEEGTRRNSSTVWLDLEETDPSRRFKMFCSTSGGKDVEKALARQHRYWIYFSPDGIHWTLATKTPATGDRSTAFYNPFRRVWVFGIRTGSPEVSRCRAYFETTDLERGPWWDSRGSVLWVGADRLDPDRSDLVLRRIPERPWDLVPSQLYNLDCVAYESLLLGMFSIWRGHPLASANENRPKINEVCVGFSRDGFHWSRPDRRAFCPVSEDKTDWNWGNVQSAGGCCLVVGDKLYIYVTGANRQPLPSGFSGVYGMDATYTALAVLRRDGFTSMDAGQAEGALTTCPVKFAGKYCFVNVAAPQGELRVEILGTDGKVITPFTKENCVPITADSTIQPVSWRGARDLSAVSGESVRFRFYLRRGHLYSFWVSTQESGASGGYVGAGGPGFTTNRDAVGSAAYEAAPPFAKTLGQRKTQR